MADFLDGLLSGEAGEPAEVVAPVEPAEPQVEAQPEPVAEPEPEAAPEPTPEPEAPKDEQRTIPLATALNWRDEAKDYKRRVEQFEAQQRQQQAPQIDPLDDPEGFAAQQQSLVQQAIINDRFERSNEDAVEKYGEDSVKAAVDWATSRAQANPAFAAEYMSKTRPIQWIVQQHQRDALLSDIGDPSKLDDWFAREAAKRGYVTPSAPVEAAPVAAVVQPAAKPAPPPRSIASDRSATSTKVSPEGERDGFLASIIGK